MNFDFDRVHDRRHMLSVKYDVVAPDVLPLWVADMDFKTAPIITEALTEFVKGGIYGYAHAPKDLYDAIISWHVKREDIVIQRNSLTIPIVLRHQKDFRALTLNGDQLLSNPQSITAFSPRLEIAV